MAQNVYECLFLFDSNRYARDPGGVSGAIPTIIQNAGGEILASRLWNEQKLAYQIRGQRKGTYWLAYFRLDSDKLVALNRACQLNDNILRNLVLKVEPRLVDALVAHAQGKPATDKPATDKPATGGPAAGKPAADKPATDKPTTGGPAADKPATGGPAADKPATGGPAAEGAPGKDSPAVGEAAAESTEKSAATESETKSAPA